MTENGHDSRGGPAGQGALVFGGSCETDRSLRKRLATVAGVVLGIGVGSAAMAAPDDCRIEDTAAVCTGDHSDGIASGIDFDPDGILALIVRDLDADITPAAGQPGILFVSGNGAVTVRNDARGHAIRTSGGAAGIVARRQGIEQSQDAEFVNSAAENAVTVTAVGGQHLDDEQQLHQSNFRHMSTDELGGVDVRNAGDVFAAGDGIDASVTLEIEQHQEVTQTNTASGSSVSAEATGAGSTATANQVIEQKNENRQIAEMTGGTVGGVVVDNAGRIVATGNGVVASSRGLKITQYQEVTQSNQILQNDVSAVAADGGNAEAIETIEQTNLNEQVARIEGVEIGDVVIRNAGTIIAAENGIVATVESGAEIGQSSDVLQENLAVEYTLSAEADGEDSVANAEQRLTQSNTNVQLAFIGDITPADIDIVNAGDIVAGGDGIVAMSSSTGSQFIEVQPLAANGDETTARDVIQENTYAQSATIPAPETGDIAVTNTGSIRAAGRGIVAIADTGEASDAAIDISTRGHIVAGQQGIFAQATSEATDARLEMTVTIEGGTVVGGDGAFGVEFADGTTNTLTNSGVLGSLSNQAVRGGDGDESVTNHGIIMGDVELGGGSNAFLNAEDGRFYSWDVVQLGGGAALTNRGIMDPGGPGAIRTTGLDVDFLNASSARYLVDLDMVTGDSDRLQIAGTADLDGEIVPFVVDPAVSRTFTIATAGTVEDNGLSVADTVLVDYALLYPDDQTVQLTADVDMSAGTGGLNDNQAAINENLERKLLDGATGDLAALYGALFAIPDIDSLADAYDRLSPEIYLDGAVSALFGGLRFSEELMSCSARTGAHVFIRQGQCGWARISGRYLSHDRTSQQIGYDGRSYAVSGGFQRRIAENWHLGLAGGYERNRIENDMDAVSRGDWLHGGMALKHTTGPWLFAGVLSGGYGWYDTKRPIALPRLATTATAENEVWHVTGRLRAAYLVEMGRSYVKPLLDVAVSHIGFSGVTEFGGPEALRVRGTDETAVTVSPALEWGAELQTAHGYALRPYVRAGATVLSDDELTVSASFNGAPDGIPFRIAKDLDRVTADVGAGVTAVSDGGETLRLNYAGRFSANLEEHAFGLKASVPF